MPWASNCRNLGVRFCETHSVGLHGSGPTPFELPLRPLGPSSLKRAKKYTKRGRPCESPATLLPRQKEKTTNSRRTLSPYSSALILVPRATTISSSHPSAKTLSTSTPFVIKGDQTESHIPCTNPPSVLLVPR